MNLMGKIFTLLIFFMSVCFLVISVMVGATHRNWKQQATLNKTKADTLQDITTSLKTTTGEKDKILTSERVARTMQLAQLESQLRVAQEKYRLKEAELKDETIKSLERLRQLEQAENRLAQQDSEVAQLRTTNATLASDIADKFSLVRSLTNEKFELQNRIQVLEELREDLSAAVAQDKKVMDRHGLTNQSLVDDIVPKLDGTVTNIGETRDLVAIGLGTDDGIRAGHKMDVYRGDRYIGKITIVNPGFNASVGRTIKEFMQDTIREGDHVTSRF